MRGCMVALINTGDRMDYAFHTLDVFTTERFGGNPLAVVLDAKGLSSTQMQDIAREFNLSETVFVLPPDNPAHSARLRIFTPATELPFAGHPTVGTAILLAGLTGRMGEGAGEAIVVLEETVGLVRVGVRRKAGEAANAEFDAPKLPEALTPIAPVDRLAAALGLAPSEIGFENHKPSRFTAGVPYTFVPVRSLDVIGRASLNSGYWAEAFGPQDGAYLYCRETLHTTSQFHARMFIPEIGEDPATGSAAVALAGAIHKFDAPKNGITAYRIEQGHEMGRPSFIKLEVGLEHGALKTVRIGGHAVQVCKGTLTV
jgi:trans-2,3-dihydro-3-hydroxyanthranilate isomerase